MSELYIHRTLLKHNLGDRAGMERERQWNIDAGMRQKVSCMAVRRFKKEI